MLCFPYSIRHTFQNTHTHTYEHELPPCQFSTLLRLMQSQKRLNYNSVHSIAKQTRKLIGSYREMGRRKARNFPINKFVWKFAIEIRKLYDNIFQKKTVCSTFSRDICAIVVAIDCSVFRNEKRLRLQNKRPDFICVCVHCALIVKYCCQFPLWLANPFEINIHFQSLSICFIRVRALCTTMCVWKAILCTVSTISWSDSWHAK